MDYRVSPDDPLLVRRLKLLYLTPLIFITYIPMVIWAGMLEIGNPFKEVREAWRR